MPATFPLAGLGPRQSLIVPVAPSRTRRRASPLPFGPHISSRRPSIGPLGAPRPRTPLKDVQRRRQSRSGGVQVVAHGDHGHAHHHHHHDHHHAHDHHGHGHSHSATNPVHGLLQKLLDASRLSPLLHWLEGSAFSSVAKIALFLAAAAASWASGRAADAATATVLHKISAAATAGVFFFAGIPAAVALALDLAALRIDTHVLMNLAVLGTLVTGFPIEGALLLVLFQTSHAVEHRLTEKAQGSLAALYASVPDHADLVSLDADGAPLMGSIRSVLAAKVAVGEVMLVKPGGQVPLDGTIVHGRALVSAEHITGEAMPALRRAGDALPAGALSHDGLLAVQAVRVADDSTPATIARLASAAQAARPQLRTRLDTFGEWYSKAVVGATVAALAVMVATGVPLLGGTGAERGALYRAMGLLTVASPCALVMVPLAYVSAVAAAASRGILLKGGRVLDALDRCRVIALDKTGTLTTGKLALSTIREIAGSSDAVPSSLNVSFLPRSAALAAAAALSLRSTHPVSNAVVEQGVMESVAADEVRVSGFSLVAGGGVTAAVELPAAADDDNDSASSNGATNSSESSSTRSRASSSSSCEYSAAFGSLDFVSGSHLSASEVDAVRAVIATGAGQATSSVSVLTLTAAEGAPQRGIWVFTFEDSLRAASAAAVGSLQRGEWAGRRAEPSLVCDVVMLTGDNESSARRVAMQVGISNIFSGLSPEDKLRQVAALRRAEEVGVGRQRGVVMVGDGLNDAAALAAADVGVAIASSASDAATLAADAVVVNDAAGVAAIPLLLDIARSTRLVVAQNLVLAFGSILALAAPTVLGFLPLWLAVMLHEGSTLLVALNSLRLLRYSAFVQRPMGGAAASEGGQKGRLEEVVPATNGTMEPVLT